MVLKVHQVRVLRRIVIFCLGGSVHVSKVVNRLENGEDEVGRCVI